METGVGRVAEPWNRTRHAEFSAWLLPLTLAGAEKGVSASGWLHDSGDKLEAFGNG
jgi:hypothetical protein